MWFSAKLLFESKVDDDDTPPLCEESIRLIDAKNEEEAKKKAKELGISEEHDYKNDLNQNVKWFFVQLIELQDLCEDSIYDGIEVFSQLFRKKNEGQADIAKSKN